MYSYYMVTATLSPTLKQLLTAGRGVINYQGEILIHVFIRTNRLNRNTVESNSLKQGKYEASTLF